MISFKALAQDAYETYRDSAQCADGAWTSVWATPAPTWEELEADHQAAWVESVKRVAQRLSELH